MKPASTMTIEKFINAIEKLIPVYLANPLDANGGGNCAVCIIDEAGTFHGKIWGTDKIRGRRYFNLACTKASQVWITGMKTGDYEKRLFNGEFDEGDFGISKPDLIGWEGGQPLTLKDGTKLFVGFSGFRGTSDLEIAVKAAAGL